jgi:hypothetical protein
MTAGRRRFRIPVVHGPVTPADNRMVRVCAHCLTAICAQGIQPCNSALADKEAGKRAPTVLKPVAVLKKLKREHASFWEGRVPR